MEQYIGMAIGALLLALGHWAGRQLGSKAALAEAVGAALVPAVTQINSTAGSVINSLVTALQQSAPAPIVTTPAPVTPAASTPAPATSASGQTAAELQAQITALQTKLAATAAG